MTLDPASPPIGPHVLRFFLGGHDLEMHTIRRLLDEHAQGHVEDKGLGWGAKASAYRTELEACLACGEKPVLVELEDDLGIEARGGLLVDHHGHRAAADAPTSLHQVFALLGLPSTLWTREFELVAANDRAYIPGLLAAGASHDEIIQYRNKDRVAQGITPEQEAEAEQGIASAELRCGGSLTVVRCAHARTAAVTDRLHTAFGGPGYVNLLVQSVNELNFFGEGRAVLALDQAFPGGWYGGALPDQGYWGGAEDAGHVLSFVEGLLAIGSRL